MFILLIFRLHFSTHKDLDTSISENCKTTQKKIHIRDILFDKKMDFGYEFDF